MLLFMLTGNPPVFQNCTPWWKPGLSCSPDSRTCKKLVFKLRKSKTFSELDDDGARQAMIANDTQTIRLTQFFWLFKNRQLYKYKDWLIILLENLLGGNPIEGGGLVTYFCVEVSPELDQEESVLRALAVQHLQAVVLFRELVLDLPHVHRLRGKGRG